MHIANTREKDTLENADQCNSMSVYFKAKEVKMKIACAFNFFEIQHRSPSTLIALPGSTS